ncbi:MAG: CinA family protein, partial [Burkholderiaceae bacterium]
MQNLQELTDYLEAHKLRVVTAESCTAGLVAAKLGAVPGC